MIYLEEIAAIDRGGKEAYLEGVRTRWAPYAERTRGMRLVWLGSTIGSTAAWPETIAVWELRDWAHYTDVCARMYTETTSEGPLREWWLDAAKLRLRSRSRTLVGAVYSPALDALVARGVSGTAFAFATYRAKPGAMAELLGAIERRAREDETRGRRLVGAYEVAFTNDVAHAIWAHPTLADLAGYEAARPANGTLACAASFSEHWAFAAPGTPLWPRDRAGGRVW